MLIWNEFYKLYYVLVFFSSFHGNKDYECMCVDIGMLTLTVYICVNVCLFLTLFGGFCIPWKGRFSYKVLFSGSATGSVAFPVGLPFLSAVFDGLGAANEK